MKSLRLVAYATLVAGWVACSAQSENSVLLTGNVPDYQGKGEFILARRGQSDTIPLQADGSFSYEVKNLQKAEEGSLVLNYLKNKKSVHCYLIPGGKLDVKITGADGEITIGDATVPDYKLTAVFTGTGKKESDYLNTPPFYNYVFKNADGTPVTFENYMNQIAEQKQRMHKALEGTCEAFAKEKTAELDLMMNDMEFIYYRRLKNDGNDASKDAGFMAFVNSIDLNDPKVSPYLLIEVIDFRLEQSPDLYKGMDYGIRFFSYLRDNIANKEWTGQVADKRMTQMLSNSDVSGLAKTFELYRTISGKSEEFKENEAIYNSLAKLLPGVKATDFEMQDKEGKIVHFLDVVGKGKVTYIDFWATWCGPCCLEIPFVEKKVEKYKDNPNIEFVSISLDRDKKEWLDKLEKDNSSWQQYIIPDNFESEFAKEYNITSIPRFMLFDKEGKIISIDAPRPSDDEAFEALIAPYVK